MKKLFFLFLVICLFLSCSTNNSNPGLLNSKSLRTQHFRINTDTDTTLVGLRGGIFSITKGSFKEEGTIDIEIKEAYSPIEIAYAGLTTESNGRLLESGGMIYFNAKKNNKQLELIKPVTISIPTNYVNKEMQLFEGIEKPDGSINWENPEPLDPALNNSPIDTGKIIFERSCTNCHELFRDMTGPPLAGIEDRVHDRNILREYIRNPVAVAAENSYFYCRSFIKASEMTMFPNLTDREIDLILDYIKNETDKRPDLKSTPIQNETAGHFKVDSSNKSSSCISAPCGFDTIYVDTTDYQLAAANMMDLHEEATKEDSMDYLYKKPDSLETAMRANGFADILQTKGRYNFKVKTLGWFNVDAFYEGLEGTEIVDLFVKSDFQEIEKLDVHVFFPAKKILTVGTFHKEDTLFHFEKYKGQIPLFLNDNAVAFAVTSIKEKIYYGITSFTVKKRQIIDIEIKETTKEELTDAFKKMNLDNIDLDIITKKRLVIPKICNDITE